MKNADLIVDVDGLGKTYGDCIALDGVTFSIRRGEVLALLGPNGAGKTTTVEILEGYRRPTGGHVRVLDQEPASAGPQWRERLGIVLQSAGMAEEMTVRELVGHFGSFYPHPRGVQQTIESAGLTEKADSRISTLSGGQKRRVDVALGIIGRPDLLFLDEPTTGFDPDARRHFWLLIENLRADGTTVLLTTHYLDEAAHLADRAVVIRDGLVLAQGALDSLGGPVARTPIVRWHDGNGPHEVRTPEPGRLVASLYAELGEATDLEVLRPSLEDIYLDIIGADDVPTVAAGAPTPASTPAH